MSIELNSDPAEVASIRKAIRDNGGYCPCSIVKDERHKCMCCAFREQDTPGACHCGLYVKVIT